MENTQQIVGYDAREMWVDSETIWPEARRKLYLYRLDVRKPLSVDTSVWPSIFRMHGRAELASHYGFQDSWGDLYDLQSAITRLHEKEPVKPFRIVAISLILGDYTLQDVNVDWTIRIPPQVNPDRIAGDWRLLGYDVADSFMLSVLSNCSLPSGIQEATEERQRWSPKLNEHHLFLDFQAAVDFKRLSDRRLKDSHAPCFVFGLWTIS